jgi:serine/threonine-protein kinase
MEFLDGLTLRQRLESEGGKLPPETAMRLTRQIASALAAAHQKGIIHRDLKPVNIMVVRDAEAPGGERAKVLDFGLAKVKEPEVGGEGLTHTGTILGTPAYMAPEQCKSARAASDRSDMYSLGIILYEMLSSDIPFDAETDAELLSKHMFSEPPPLQQKAPHVAPQLCALVHRMLRKEPQDRPSAAEVVQELSHLLSGVGVAVSGPHKLNPAASKPPAPPRTPPQRPLGDEPTVVQPERGSDGKRPSPSPPPAAPSPPPSAATPPTQTPTPIVPPPAERPARRGVALVLSAVVLLGLGVAGGMMLQERQRQLVERAQPRLVRWSIASLPADAEVLGEGGKVLGRTPLSVEEARGVGTRALTLRLAGHADKNISLPLDHDAAVSEALTPLPPDAGAAPRDGGARDAAPAPDADDDDAPRKGGPEIF